MRRLPETRTTEARPLSIADITYCGTFPTKERNIPIRLNSKYYICSNTEQFYDLITSNDHNIKISIRLSNEGIASFDNAFAITSFWGIIGISYQIF